MIAVSLASKVCGGQREVSNRVARPGVGPETDDEQAGIEPRNRVERSGLRRAKRVDCGAIGADQKKLRMLIACLRARAESS